MNSIQSKIAQLASQRDWEAIGQFIRTFEDASEIEKHQVRVYTEQLSDLAAIDEALKHIQ